MHPILFELGGHAVHSYGVLQALGLFLGISLGVWQGRRQGWPASWLWDLGILIILAGVGGARLEYVRLRWSEFAAQPARILDLGDGGEVFYGGLIGAILVVVAYTRWRGMAWRGVVDAYAAAVPLGHALGRIGCFAAGCCYGAPSGLPWAVVFPPGSRAPAGLPLHPVQLYEAAFDTLLGLGLLFGPRLAPGRRFAAMLVLYPAFRAFNELFRGDAVRGFVGVFSTAQLTSLLLLGVGLAVWFSAPGTGRTAPEAR